jgi:AcrR family transcriptional regulator
MPETAQTPVKAPKQPRSRKTLERLVQAGLQILEEEGAEGFTVQAVVARARSSVGSFYARFGGKDDLLAHLREHIRDKAIDEWGDAVLSKTSSIVGLSEAAAAVVGLLFEARSRWDAGLRSAARLAPHDADHDAFRRRVVEELAARLLEHTSEIGHERPEIAVRVGLWGVLGAIDHEQRGALGSELSLEVLEQECKELLLGYLMGSARRRRGQVEFFDVWG